MSEPLKPIYLFADSQLLFWKNNGVNFGESIRARVEHDHPKAAYIGASNGDNPDYYTIFESAMDNIGVHDCRMIRSHFSVVDELFLNEADIILLAGGDTKQGWEVFARTGLKEIITRRYYESAILIGVSAGAVQLGLLGWQDEFNSVDELFDTFKLVPFIISSHDEKNQWESLKKVIQLKAGSVKGVGIPAGSGMIYHPDRTIEAVRYPIHEYLIKDGKLSCCLLLPVEATEKYENLDSACEPCVPQVMSQ